MAEIIRKAAAGTMESSDAYVEVEPGKNGIEIQLESVVKGQFGSAIEAVAKEVLSECGISAARVNIIDRGALDCVLRARVETAVLRGRSDEV